MKGLHSNSVSTYRHSGFHARKRKFLRWDTATVVPSLRTEFRMRAKMIKAIRLRNQVYAKVNSTNK